MYWDMYFVCRPCTYIFECTLKCMMCVPTVHIYPGIYFDVYFACADRVHISWDIPWRVHCVCRPCTYILGCTLTYILCMPTVYMYTGMYFDVYFVCADRVHLSWDALSRVLCVCRPYKCILGWTLACILRVPTVYIYPGLYLKMHLGVSSDNCINYVMVLPCALKTSTNLVG